MSVVPTLLAPLGVTQAGKRTGETQAWGVVADKLRCGAAARLYAANVFIACGYYYVSPGVLAYRIESLS